MSLAAMGLGSMSSGEFHIADPDRTTDIESRHELLAAFLAEHRYDAILLTKPSNFAWFTGGADSTRGSHADVASALFVTPDARVIVTRNTDSAKLFDRDLPSLGFQLKERLWQESRSVLMSDLCRGRNVASDAPFERCIDSSMHLAGMRLPLSKYETRQLRELGQLVAHSVEATARNFDRGLSEAEIAGQVSHRLIRNQIQPERIQVWADGQGQHYRHWSYGIDPAEEFCTITVIGRRGGLHAGASRTISFGTPAADIREAHLACQLVQATGMFFSQDQWEIDETWKRVERIYEKFGHTEEWHLCDQGCVTGYELCESPIVPRSQFRLQAGMPVFWQSSVGPALTADTILIKPKGFELITPMENWPQLEVDVKGVKIPRPDILMRPA